MPFAGTPMTKPVPIDRRETHPGSCPIGFYVSRAPKMRQKSWLLTIILATSLVATTGCLYLRLQEFKNQLRDFDRFFEVNEQQGLCLVFQKPVLLAGDIQQLMEAGPASREQTDDGELWTYIYEKQYANGGQEEQQFDIHATLVMQKDKLREVRFPERFLSLLPKEYLLTFLRTIGQAKVDRKQRRVTSSWEEKRTSSQAASGATITRQDVVKRLGIPYRVFVGDQTEVLTYEYHLKDCVIDPDEKQTKFKSWIRFTFRTPDQRLLKVDIKFGGIKISMDMVVTPGQQRESAPTN